MMHISRLVAIVTVPFLLTCLPVVAGAQQSTPSVQSTAPSPAQVKAAVKQALMSVGLSMRQKRDIKKMVDDYDSQTANADAATKQAAQKTLLENIYGELSPSQQSQFKASIKQSLGADMQP